MPNKDLITIANHYGLSEQLIKTAEECSELAQAALKCRQAYDRWQAYDQCTKNNLIEEIADVQIMINQLIWLMGIERDVDRVMDAKIKRQLERMEQEA